METAFLVCKTDSNLSVCAVWSFVDSFKKLTNNRLLA
jgi:hypothetical protein